LGDAYGAENFAQGEPDGVGNRRVMLVRFAQATAHRLHRLSGREVVDKSKYIYDDLNALIRIFYIKYGVLRKHFSASQIRARFKLGPPSDQGLSLASDAHQFPTSARASDKLSRSEHAITSLQCRDNEVMV
jgi:hypothetical protein